MKKFLFVSLCLVGFMVKAQPGTLVNSVFLDDYELNEIPGLLATIGIPDFLVDQNFGIDLYKITYETTSPLGDSIIEASGLVVLPKSTDYEFPIFHYNAGTHYYDENLSSLDNEALALAMIAVEGNIAIGPDYIGYADSPISIPHPYLHAETEASCSVDMLKASKTFVANEGLHFNNDIIFGGYSQGAHAALATLRSIQNNNPENYHIKGTFTGAGPYDLSGSVIDHILDGNTLEGYFLPFLVEGYQYMYGDVYTSYDQVYAAPWDSIVPRVFDKTDPYDLEDASFPNMPLDILNESYLLDLQSDTNHVLRQHLKENDIYKDWFPEDYTKLYHCNTDDYVVIANSVTAYNSFVAQGAPNVGLVENLEPNMTHVSCFTPYLLNLKGFIAEVNTHAPLSLVELDDLSKLKWFVQNGALHVQSDKAVEEDFTLYSIEGKALIRGDFNGELQLDLKNIPGGTYFIRFQSSTLSVILP